SESNRDRRTNRTTAGYREDANAIGHAEAAGAVGGLAGGHAMTREMSHDEAFAALGALAIDALEADERTEVLAHVSTCLTCRQDLAARREAAPNLPFPAPAAAVGAETRDRIRGRLLARAAADARHSAAKSPNQRTEIVPITSRWGGARVFAAAASI